MLCMTVTPGVTATGALVAWWKLNSSGGSAAADSAGSNTGTLINGASWAPGGILGGNAVSVGDSAFNGSGGGVTFPINLPASFTLYFWSKANDYFGSSYTGPDNNVLFGGETYLTNGFRSGFTAAGVFIFWTSESGGDLTLSDTTAAPAGTWQQYAITYSGGAGSLYRNGTLVSSASGAYVTGTTGMGLASEIGGVRQFYGLVDQVRLYNYPLSPSAITALYNSDLGSTSTPTATATPPVRSALNPTNLTATAISSGQINLAWSPPSGTVTGYQIWRQGVLIATTNTSATTYDDSVIAPSTTWSYQVAGIIGGSATSLSNSASATTFAVAPHSMPSFSCPGGAVVLNSGQDIHAIISGAPAGTTFCFSAGTYRAASTSYSNLIEPLPNDVFIGGPGVDLKGSIVVSSWTQPSGSYYQSNSGLPVDSSAYNNSNCQSGYPLCGQTQDLYFNGTPLMPVTSLSALQSAGSGYWYFDTSSGTAYVMQNPSGNTLELSVQQSAIDADNSNPSTGQSGVPNVTFEGFIVEQFATPEQYAAIGHQTWQQQNTSNWTIEYNETRYNHYKGINAGDGSTVIGNWSHDNGDAGGACGNNNCTVENNEFSHNGYAGYNCQFECGGSKNVTSNSTYEGNYFHDNYGSGNQAAPGLWLDINSYNNLVQSNNMSNNSGSGLFYEISCNGLIQYNLLSGNGSVSGGWVWNSAITLSTSSSTTVNGNVISNQHTGYGLAVAEQNRGNGGFGPSGQCYPGTTMLARNNAFSNNIVTLNGPGQNAAAVAQDNGDSGVFSGNNTFTADTYNGLANTADPFVWENGNISSSQWRGFGNDVNGAFNQ